MDAKYQPTGSRISRWSERKLEKLLAPAGVRINGNQPFDMQIHHPEAATRILRQGTLGLGETYMDGFWDSEQLDVMVEKLLVSRLDASARQNWSARTFHFAARMINLQSKARAAMVAKRHYDIGNDLFERMLDPSMNYSCGYWLQADTLAGAQQDKMELVARKLQLQPGMKLLDIGCGWGGMARHAAEHFGVEVTGITISREQAALARQRVAGLPVEILECDYREVRGKFDRIVSIGMFEHVGYKNYESFFRHCRQLLADDGLVLLHTIGGNESSAHTDPWINRYIFPNGMLPSIAQLGKAIEAHFVMEDWHNFGAWYDPTLMAWHDNINRSWDQLGDRYNERFRRMWNYYLLSCAGAFRARRMQLWQLVLSTGNLPGVYQRPVLQPAA